MEICHYFFCYFISNILFVYASLSFGLYIDNVYSMVF